MADPLDWYRSALGGDVGTGIPLNLDRTPVPDTGQGTAWSHLQQAPGDILTAALGLLERAQLGGANALGLRSPGSDIYRAQIPVEPGLRAAEGAATFATGGLASSLFPGAGALKAGAQYAVPPGTLPGLLADEMGGIRAFHASPYDFDRFSLDKIGTGEGAQAYGHGLYFAGNEATSKAGYLPQLKDIVFATSGRDKIAKGDAFEALIAATRDSVPGLHPDQYRQIATALGEGIEQSGSIAKYLRDYELPGGQFGPAYQAAAGEAERLGLRTNPGHMYEVDINADPKAFLDWDKPLTEQSPHVQNALEQLRGSLSGMSLDLRPGQVPIGRDAYHRLSVGGDPSAPGTAFSARPDLATQQLREVGVPGIRYLDQGSRGAGQGTSNYAVGDDSLIQILRKYGLLPPVAGAGLMGGDNQ